MVDSNYPKRPDNGSASDSIQHSPGLRSLLRYISGNNPVLINLGTPRAIFLPELSKLHSPGR